MTYDIRNLTVDIYLGQGKNGDEGYELHTIKNARVIAEVHKAGGTESNTANIRIYGLPPELMNRISTLGKPMGAFARHNRVVLSAGDSTNRTPAIVYQGTIIEAWADISAMPDVAFVIQGLTGFMFKTKAPDAPTTTIKGEADIDFLMRKFATAMNLAYENSQDVHTKLSDMAFQGTLLDQVRQAADAAWLNYFIDDDRVLAIWPRFSYRKGEVPLISKDTGMVRSPTFGSQAIMVETLYDPSIFFGCRVKVKSEFLPIDGVWNVFALDTQLSSEMPGGPWFSRLTCFRWDSDVVVP